MQLEPVAGTTRSVPSTIAVIFGYPLAFVAFAYTFRTFLAEEYAYQNYLYVSDPFRYQVSLVVVIVTSLFLAARRANAAGILLHVHFVLPILPMIVLYAVGGTNQYYFACSMAAFALLYAVSAIPISGSTHGILSARALMYLMLALALAYVALIIAFGGLRFFNLDLYQVYDFRRDAADNLPGAFSYLSPNISRIAIPVLVALGLYWRNLMLIFGGVALGLFIFATTAHKAPLFAPIAVIMIFLMTRRPEKAPALIVGGAILAAVLTLAEPSLGIVDRDFGSLIFRRTIFTPAQLNYAYFDFFVDHTKLFWTTTSLNIAGLPAPIDEPAPSVVGYEFFGTDVFANTGWLGAGYAHAGVAGMLLYATVIGLLMSMSNLLAKKTTVAVAVSILLVPYMTMFTAADLPTMFLTHGLLGILLIIAVLKPLANEKQPGSHIT